MKRRRFLQQTGLLLAGAGVSETGIQLLGDRYAQSLAKPTPRKLALLVGVDQYPRTPEMDLFAPLQGCATDVALQRELLIHRFGFQAADILTLTNQQATREQIEAAFLDHLVSQTQAGDVVVFHFSGYGRPVKIGQTSSAADDAQNSLVPIDGVLSSDGGSLINYVLEDTLLLLLRSLKTNRVTTVLDTGYLLRQILGADPTQTAPPQSTSPIAAEVRVPFLRSRRCATLPAGQASEAELAFQDQLMRQTRSSPQKVRNARLFGQTPGLILVATGNTKPHSERGMLRDRLDEAEGSITKTADAYEAQWSGFSAGLFTYALTQYLWSATPATRVQVSFSQMTSSVEQLVGTGQRPALGGQKSGQTLTLADHLPPISLPGVVGIVRSVSETGTSGEVWLAGLPATVLEHYASNALLEVVDQSPPATSTSAENLQPVTYSSETKIGTVSRSLLGDEPLLDAEKLPTSSNESSMGAEASPSELAKPDALASNVLALPTAEDRLGRTEALSAPSVSGTDSPASASASPRLEPSRVLLVVQSREGLLARVKVVEENSTSDRSTKGVRSARLQVGQPVREVVRSLSRNVGLAVALDPTLERIERVDATSAISGLPQVRCISGDQPVDCLFGKLTRLPVPLATNRPSPQALVGENTSAEAGGTNASLPSGAKSERIPPPEATAPQRHYGLFSLTREPIPSSLGMGDEAIKSAVYRIMPQFNTLLAAKLWRLLTNEGATTLAIGATLETVVGEPTAIAYRETAKTTASVDASTWRSLPDLETGIPVIPVGTPIRYQVYNFGDQALYWLLVGLDSSGNAIAFMPQSSSTNAIGTPIRDQLPVLNPRATLVIPRADGPFDWVLQEPRGFAETQIILSTAPLTKTAKALNLKSRASSRIDILKNPVEVMQALLTDLEQANAEKAVSGSADGIALDVNLWATLGFAFHVV